MNHYVNNDQYKGPERRTEKDSDGFWIVPVGFAVVFILGLATR